MSRKSPHALLKVSFEKMCFQCCLEDTDCCTGSAIVWKCIPNVIHSVDYIQYSSTSFIITNYLQCFTHELLLNVDQTSCLFCITIASPGEYK